VNVHVVFSGMVRGDLLGYVAQWAYLWRLNGVQVNGK
jgi:hypothetical protein